MFDIVPDEDHPYAELSAYDADGEQIAKVRTSAAFKFNATAAANWIEAATAGHIRRHHRRQW